jgi:DNA polymerase III subunit epsilon
MNFVAIDFETANEKRNSACSLGITVVKNNRIAEERYWLIRPEEMRFAPVNIMIHGIYPAQVVNEPTFDLLWPEILPYIENSLVIAHNAAFDISVLRNTLAYYQIPFPYFTYGCTLAMSRKYFSYLPNYKLNTVSKHLGYTFQHHHASADASACANILIEIAQELQLDSFNEIAKKVGVCPGKVYPGGYKPATSKGTSVTSNRQFELLTQEVLMKQRSVPSFKDKVVAITGGLRSMSRNEAIELIHDNGGRYSSSVTKKTNMLLTNVKNPDTIPTDMMSTKLRRTLYLREMGQDIVIVSEDNLGLR